MQAMPDVLLIVQRKRGGLENLTCVRTSRDDMILWYRLAGLKSVCLVMRIGRA